LSRDRQKQNNKEEDKSPKPHLSEERKKEPETFAELREAHFVDTDKG
jgi:hypothetical protein